MGPEVSAISHEKPRAAEADNLPVGRSRHGLKEVALAALSLALVATLIYLPHIRHGGFYFDDWADAAARFYPPGGPGLAHVLDVYSGLFPYRPALILYIPLKYYVFGANIPLQLAWTVALGVIAATFLYGILRFFSVPWYHAWLIAALTLAFPWFDSTRFWEAASLSTFAIVLALGGLWLALVGLERRSWRFHACAAALYLVSILAYEITLPAIAAAGILYALRFGWRNARARWGVDLLVVSAAGVWNAAHTNRTVSSISGDVDHLQEIVVSGGTILGRTLYPLGPHGHTTTVLALLGALYAGGAVVYFTKSHQREDGEWGLKQWLLLASAGLAIAVLGWVMFIPADPYYTPSVYGFTNRVNALSGLGLAVAAYAALGIGMTLVVLFAPRVRRLAPAIVVVLGLALGAAYVHVVERHSGIWGMAYRAERQGMDQIKRAFPDLPPETTVIASGYPAYQTLGVPIFASTWDLNGMIKLEYNDGSLSAFPLTSGLELVCRVGGVGMRGVEEAPPTVAPYGKVRLLDLQTGRRSAPRNQRQCRTVAGNYVPGPMYLSSAY